MEPADLVRLSQDDTHVVHRSQREPGFAVREAQGVRWLTSADGTLQSAMRIDAPADPALPNHLLMLAALLLCPQPERSLELGSGVGAIERFLADRFADTTRTCVDSCAELTQIGREFFGMPSDWQPVQIRAADYLKQSDQRYSLIFADLFDGAAHSDCVADEAFYADCADHLEDEGAVAINLSPESESDLLALLLQMRKHLPWVSLAAVPEHGNIVAVATKSEPPDDGTLRQRAKYLGESWRLDLAGALQRLERLPPPAAQ